MDFRGDVRAENIGDQFMYGPAFLVNPVTEPAASTRRLYLPKARWYDFWSGTSADGGQVVDGPAPLERMPLYIRAGSIVPMGPDLEWSTQKPADPIELRVYRGADGDFTLYEDENDTYNYEKGSYATIPFHWDDAKQSLTIGHRQGKFPGMLSARTFRIVFVGDNHGVGIGPTDEPDKTVTYSGEMTSVSR
jgi:alpha-D-xyloside xylohydrolase